MLTIWELLFCAFSSDLFSIDRHGIFISVKLHNCGSGEAWAGWTTPSTLCPQLPLNTSYIIYTAVASHYFFNLQFSLLYKCNVRSSTCQLTSKMSFQNGPFIIFLQLLLLATIYWKDQRPLIVEWNIHRRWEDAGELTLAIHVTTLSFAYKYWTALTQLLLLSDLMRWSA